MRASSIPAVLVFVVAGFAGACGAQQTASRPPPAIDPPPRARVDAPPVVPACPSGAVAAAPSASGRPPKMVIEERQNDRIDSLAFTPDGQMLAAASAARAVTVWSVRDRSLLRTLRIPALLPPLSVEWSARGEEIAIGQTSTLLVDAGREAVVAQFLNKYGSGTGSYLRRVPGHPGQAWIGVDGNDMALFGDDRKIAATLRWPSGSKEAGAWVKQIAVSSDGRVAAVAAASKGVFVWDLGQPASEARSVAIDGDAVGVAITPRGDRAFVAVRAKNAAPRIDVVDVAAARVASALDMGPDAAKDGDWVTTIAVSSDGAVAAAGSLHRVTAWTVATGARRWVVDADRVVVRSRHDLQSSVQAIAFSPTELLLAAANARGDVFFLDPRNGRLLGELGVEVRRPHTLLFSEDSRSLLTLSAQHASRWSIDEGRLVGANLAPGVAAASRLPKGDFLIGRAPLSLQIAMPTDPPPACPVGTVPIFLAPWSQPDDLAALPGFVSRGIRVVSGSAAASAPDPGVTSSAPLCIPNAFTLYDLNVPTKRALVQFLNDAVGVVGTADKRVVTLKGSKEYRFANALSPDGKRATGSNLDKVLVWDAATGDVQTTIPIPGGAVVLATAFSRDGTRIAVANGMTVEVHALPAGDLVWRGAVTQSLMAVTFAGDGRDVFVASFTGSIAQMHEGQVASVLESTAGGGAGRLAISPDGRLLASMHQDGGVRIWDTQTKALRATMVDFEDDEWVIATPGGAFTGTDEVGRRIGWTFESPIERVGFEQLSPRFRDDAIVRRRLSTGEGDVQIELRRPPSVAFEGAPTRANGKTRVHVHATSATRVDAVLAFREGRAIGAPQPVCRADGEVTFELPELAGENRFTFTAVDDRGVTSRALTLDVTSDRGERPDLWIVAIGVSAYPRLDPQEQLKVAHQDASAIAAAFGAQAGPGRAFAKLHSVTLPDEHATVKAVRDALAGLAAMSPDDLAVVFLAGHGVKVSDSADMRFLTRNADHSAASVAADGIGWSEIAEKLAAARGRVLLLLDACHSGHMSQELVVPNGALAAGLSRQGRAGVLVFAAAKGRQLSFEDPQHGLFTRAILDTLADPTADRDRDGRLEVTELIDAVTVRVDTSTRGGQTPWVTRREVFGDFQIATPSAPPPGK